MPGLNESHADSVQLLSFLLPEMDRDKVENLLKHNITRANTNTPTSTTSTTTTTTTTTTSCPPPLSLIIDHEQLDPLKVLELNDLSHDLDFPPSPNSSNSTQPDLDEHDLDDIIQSLQRDNILLTPPVTPAVTSTLSFNTTTTPCLSPTTPLHHLNYNKPWINSNSSPITPNHSCSIFITPTFRANQQKSPRWNHYYNNKRKNTSDADIILSLPPISKRRSYQQKITENKDTRNIEKENEKDNNNDTLIQEENDTLIQEENDTLIQEENDTLIQEEKVPLKSPTSIVSESKAISSSTQQDLDSIDIYDGLSDCSDETISLNGQESEL